MLVCRKKLHQKVQGAWLAHFILLILRVARHPVIEKETRGIINMQKFLYPLRRKWASLLTWKNGNELGLHTLTWFFREKKCSNSKSAIGIAEFKLGWMEKKAWQSASSTLLQAFLSKTKVCFVVGIPQSFDKKYLPTKNYLIYNGYWIPIYQLLFKGIRELIKLRLRIAYSSFSGNNFL